MLGASLGQFGGNSTQVFFVTWFPTYLVTARGMTFIQAGLMTSLPYIGASAGVLAGGLISDMILKRTGSANLSRKLPIVGGMLLASTIVAANYVPIGSDGLVILIMSIAFFGQGMTNLGWTVVSDVAPKKLIGLTQRDLQLQRQPGGDRHAADHRHRLRSHRIVRRAARLHRGGGAGRRVFVQCDPGRHSPPRDCDRLAMPIDGFQHVNIRTTDADRARDFYVRALGLRVGDRPPFASVGYWLYLGDVPVVHLVQLAPDDTREPGSGRLDHVAFHGVDLEATRQTLTAAGIPFREAIVPRDNTVQIFIHDPDGLKIELNFEAERAVSRTSETGNAECRRDPGKGSAPVCPASPARER